jgi:hypothetical protein
VLITRSAGGEDILNPAFLTTRPLRNLATASGSSVHKVVIELVGSHLSLAIDGEPTLEYRDLQPLSIEAEGGAQLAIATHASQALVRGLRIERRRSPLVIPAHAIGGELLRQGLHAKAAAFYRAFLDNHPEAIESVEARYMLAMALSEGNRVQEAEAALRDLLSDHFDHPLAQDAIFELARIRLDSPNGGIRKAVQEVLAYQDTGDVVRTRFCLWLLSHLREVMAMVGLTSELEFDLRLVRSLIKGSPDEEILLSTIAAVLSPAMLGHLDRLVDCEDEASIASQRQSIRRLASFGLRLRLREPRLHNDYRSLADHLRRVDDPAEAVLVTGRGLDDPEVVGDFVRTMLWFHLLGDAGLVLRVLDGDDLTPLERLLRASLRRLKGDLDGAQADLDWCFRLTDVLETERTNLVILMGARLGCFGLGYLPWDLVEDGLLAIRGDTLHAPLLAVAALLAEAIGDGEVARRMYGRLAEPGTGFRAIGVAGLGRVGAAG